MIDQKISLFHTVVSIFTNNDNFENDRRMSHKYRESGAKGDG